MLLLFNFRFHRFSTVVEGVSKLAKLFWKFSSLQFNGGSVNASLAAGTEKWAREAEWWVSPVSPPHEALNRYRSRAVAVERTTRTHRDGRWFYFDLLAKARPPLSSSPDLPLFICSLLRGSIDGTRDFKVWTPLFVVTISRVTFSVCVMGFSGKSGS